MSTRESWKVFFQIIGSPWSLLLIISSVLLSILLIFQSDRTLIATFTILVTLSSGLLGGVLAK